MENFKIYKNRYSLNDFSILNLHSKDIISSLKLISESYNNSKKLLSDNNDNNENNNNEYFNFDDFVRINEDNTYYYENFYPKD